MAIMVEVSENVEVEFDVDLELIVADLSEADKQKLARRIGVNLSGADDTYVREAYAALLRNRPNEALAYLENYLHPNIGGRIKAAVAKEATP